MLFSVFFNVRKLIVFKKVERKIKIVFRYELFRYKVVFIGFDEVWSVINGIFNSVFEFFGLDLLGFLMFFYVLSIGNFGFEDMK